MLKYVFKYIYTISDAKIALNFHMKQSKIYAHHNSRSFKTLYKP